MFSLFLNKWLIRFLLLSLILLSASPFAVKAEQTNEAELSNLPYITLQTKKVDKVNQAQIRASEIERIAQKHPLAVIEFKSVWGSYLLPVNALDYAAWAKKLEVDLSELMLQVKIERIDETKQIDKWKERLGDAQLLSPLVRFAIELVAKGEKYELKDSNGRYISRTIVLQEQMDSRGLTAVSFNEETGNIAFVPAVFQNLQGMRLATIKSPHDRLYGIVRYAKSFEDLNQHWAKQEIELLASKLVIQGVTITRFDPNAEMTYVQWISLLLRSLGLNPDVEAALNVQIIGNNSDGGVNEQQLITREQMAVMLSNALKWTNHSVNLRERADLVLASYADTQLISSWAILGMEQVVDTGIMRGKTKTSLAPREPVTRAEAAVMLKRFMQFVHFID